MLFQDISMDQLLHSFKHKSSYLQGKGLDIGGQILTKALLSLYVPCQSKVLQASFESVCSAYY